MNAATVVVILASLGFSSALFSGGLKLPFKRCTNDADCEANKCCAGLPLSGKYLKLKACVPKLPVNAYCNFMPFCGCEDGSSCQVTFKKTILGRDFVLKQCVKDDVSVDESKNVRRFLIRKCSNDSVAKDCGRERCCILGKYCAPLIPKYLPCNFVDVHKCPCGAGLECRITKQLTTPEIAGIIPSTTTSWRQCMPVEESNEVEEVELTEE